MEAAIQLLRSNYVYRQVFRSIGKQFANFETVDFSADMRDVSVDKREICLLARREREREGLRVTETMLLTLGNQDLGS